MKKPITKTTEQKFVDKTDEGKTLEQKNHKSKNQ